MLKKYSPKEINRSIQRYIQLCDKVKDILDRDHFFDPGDFFYHPDLGVNEVDRNRGDGKFYCKDPEFKIFEIESRECVWLPSEEQLKKLASNINLTSYSLEHFLDDNKGYFGYPAGIKPIFIFITPEEQWMAYYMFEWHKWIWSTEKKDWVKTYLA